MSEVVESGSSIGHLSFIGAALTPQECRCARTALNWSKDKLAELAHVSVWTISRFENGRSRFWPTTAERIVETLRDGGVLIERENGFSVIKFMPAETEPFQRPRAGREKPDPMTGPG